MRPLGFALASAIAIAACAKGSDIEPVASSTSAATGPSGFCRTTTCAPPREFPLDGKCQPDGWGDHCGAFGQSNAPLWWATSCVGYDIQKSGSRHVSYDAASKAIGAAFATWTRATCNGGAKVGIDVRDLGPVACASRGYDKDGPNQNLVVFHDDTWPYEAKDRAEQGSRKSLTIALTTATYDTTTGEIFDADMEINTADYWVAPAESTPPGTEDAFDLQAVVLHEAGHFFGLAHSPRDGAVMYASAGEGGTGKRDLAPEDVAGICAIYPGDGTRSVASLVDPSGHVPAKGCDPTPRHGYTGECVAQHGCAIGRARTTSAAWLAIGAAIAIALRARRRR